MPAATNPKKKSLMPSGPLRSKLRGAGHSLEPVVQIGHHGTTDAVVKQVRQALLDHELVKIRLGTECPDDRFDVAARLSTEDKLQIVQILGRTILVYQRDLKKSRFES